MGPIGPVGDHAERTALPFGILPRDSPALFQVDPREPERRRRLAIGRKSPKPPDLRVTASGYRHRRPIADQALAERHGLRPDARFASRRAADKLPAQERRRARPGALSPSEVRDVLKTFHGFEERFPNATRVHALVTPRLPPTLAWLARDPRAFRGHHCQPARDLDP